MHLSNMMSSHPLERVLQQTRLLPWLAMPVETITGFPVFTTAAKDSGQYFQKTLLCNKEDSMFLGSRQQLEGRAKCQ